MLENRAMFALWRLHFPYNAAVRATASAVGWVEHGLFGLYKENSKVNGEVKVVQLTTDRCPDCYKNARLLVLGSDATGGEAVHSVFRLDDRITNGYWDVLATLPAFVKHGPIGIYGLGSGTVAHMIARYFPERQMEGWELDESVLIASRMFMGVGGLEETGKLVCNVGDCLRPSATVPDGFVGLIVDLYSRDSLIPEVYQVETWESFKERLAWKGRMLANIGKVEDNENVVKMLLDVFEGNVQFKTYEANTLALTGPRLTERDFAGVPPDLRHLTEGWWRASDDESD